MNSSSPRYSQAAWGTAIPSLPSEPADRLYWLEGQLFVAIPISRYQALVGSQASHASHFSFPSHDTYAPVQSSAVLTSAQSPPPTTAASCTNSPASTVEPHARLDNPRSRTRRVPVACANCHEMRKSCDAARPCQRCVRRGLGASCVDHARAARRSFPGQSPSDSSSAMSPAVGNTVPFIGTEGPGGSSGQNAPLFPPQYPSFLLEETAAAAAANNMDMNALWGSY